MTSIRCALPALAVSLLVAGSAGTARADEHGSRAAAPPGATPPATVTPPDGTAPRATPPPDGTVPAGRAPPAATPPADPATPVGAFSTVPPVPRRSPPANPELEVGGRVFVRDTVSRVVVADMATWSHDRTIDSGRLFANYRRAHLKLAIEVEFAGGARLKDTYIRLWPNRLARVQAGRFKVPISYIALESKWSLPSIERGLLSEIAPDARGLPFAGERDDGLEVELRPDLALNPRLTLASMQTPLPGGTAQLDPSEDLTQDLYARLEVEPVHDLHLASTLAWTGYDAELGRVDTYHHVPMVSAELFFDGHALRTWLEGFAGKSFVYHADNTTSGTFWAARGLVSPRLHHPTGWLWRLEPYISGSVFDPSTDVSGDRISEVGGGIAVWPSKFWRLQIEVDNRVAEGLAAPVADSTLIRVQLGSAFAQELK